MEVNKILLKLRAQKGKARYSIQSARPQRECTGGSSIEEQRPLLGNDGEFFDEETREYVTLERILRAFLDSIPTIITKFEKDLEG